MSRDSVQPSSSAAARPTDAERMAAQIAAHAAADRLEEDQIAGLSLQERGEMIISACRAAAEIYRSRLAAGFPPEEPEPWPESTVEFLKKSARDARRTRPS